MSFRELERLRHQLPLPPLLMDLLAVGRWTHPGDDVMREKVPFIHDPLIFLSNHEEMISESGPLMDPNETESHFFSEYRGSKAGQRDLPWIDVEKTVVIICSKIPGDDVAIVLDYRSQLEHPRVVGSDWHSANNLEWREISHSFPSFVELLGIGDEGT